MKHCRWPFALALCLACSPLSASTEKDKVEPFMGRATVEAVRLSDGESITIDGRLDEAMWARAVPATDFKQQDPDNGQPATETTEVRVIFDRDRLILGVECTDSEPDRLLGNQMQRDQPFSGDDRFMWSLDPYLDGRSGYFFEINPSGAMGDGIITGGGGGGGFGGFGGGMNKAWDGIWLARIQRHGKGWSAEIEIPFRTLNFDPNAPAWGANFQRTVRRKNEESLWTGFERNQGLTKMSNAGAIVGIKEVSQGVGLDVKPYVVGSFADLKGRGLGTTYTGDAGLDFFYNVTPQIKANFTLNTDFAETEVDQRRVNLTRFPLFFPEKRDFFLEGAGYFDFSQEGGNAIMPFFSRRIGLDSNGNPQKIDYGAKMTGQAGAFDLGVLQVRTGTQGDSSGEDFTVMRTRRRMLRQSYVGAIMTRRATRNSTLADRYSAGVDFELSTSRFRGNQNLELSGFWLANNTPNKGGDGDAYGFRIDYPNELWNGRFNYRVIGRNYSPATGFSERNDVRRYHPVMRFSPRPKNNRFIRRFSFEAWNELLTNTRNEFISAESRISVFEVNFHSGDFFQIQLNPKRERLETDFKIRDGIVLPKGREYGTLRYSARVNTGNRRKISGGTEFEFGEFYSGRRREFNVNVGIRPRPGIFLSLNGEWNKVRLAEGSFSTSLIRAVANTQFSPWISLVNNVQYDTVSRVLGWQFRFRWIVRPGNDVYFVYLHNWIDASGRMSTLDRNAATKIVYTHRF